MDSVWNDEGLLTAMEIVSFYFSIYIRQPKCNTLDIKQ